MVELSPIPLTSDSAIVSVNRSIELSAYQLDTTFEHEEPHALREHLKLKFLINIMVSRSSPIKCYILQIVTHDFTYIPIIFFFLSTKQICIKNFQQRTDKRNLIKILI